MLIPWVKPVIAGKNKAKAAQNGISPEGDQLAASRPPSHCPRPPTKKVTMAANSTAMTRY